MSILLDTLKRIEDRQIDDGKQLAVLVSTRETDSRRLDDEITERKKLDSKVVRIDTWRTDLKAKIGVYAALAGAVVAFIGGIAKDALANVLHLGQ